MFSKRSLGAASRLWCQKHLKTKKKKKQSWLQIGCWNLNIIQSNQEMNPGRISVFIFSSKRLQNKNSHMAVALCDDAVL